MGFSEQLDALQRDDAYKALQKWKPSFNLYKSLGIVGRELSHSALLAFLLDPNETHGLGWRFLRTYLESAVDARTLTHKRDLSVLRDCVANLSESSNVVVRKEHFFIDVVVEVPEAQLVIGIENKIWAEEQLEQLTRYQNQLRDHYRGWTTLAVFLTPGGYMPWTGALDHETPCVAMDWRTIGTMITGVAEHAEPSARDFLSNTAMHIEEDIMGDDKRKALVRALFAKPGHREALQAIVQFEPSLADCVSAVEQRLTQLIVSATGEQPKVERGRNCRETVLTFGTPPISFIVHDQPWEEGPGIFVGAVLNRMAAHRPEFEAFASRAKDIVDPKFEIFQKWNGWHRILGTDELSRPGHYVPDSVFDKKFVDEVAKTAESYLAMFAPALSKASA